MLNVDNFIPCQPREYYERASVIRAMCIDRPFILENKYIGKTHDYLIFLEDGTKYICERKQFETIYETLEN